MYIHVHNPNVRSSGHLPYILLRNWVWYASTLSWRRSADKGKWWSATEAEAGPFAVHRDASFSLLPRQGVTESHVIVADAESYLHILPLTVDE